MPSGHPEHFCERDVCCGSAGDIMPAMAGTVSVNSCSPLPPPHIRAREEWGQEDFAAQCVSHAWQPCSSFPSSTSLSLQEYTFVFKRKSDLLLCFQTGFSGHNGPNPLSKCYCIGIHNSGQEAIHEHLSDREQV